ncbi:MAG: 3-methyl-2-oxobutanoate hydroxymethyltransferase [Pirellulaceae bacterium]|nr:3-methyl-2-oxobutanoate hydroxymethyltransferase [Planctomycetales bacterium]
MSANPERSQRLTVPAFQAMKRRGQKIAVLTAYDFSTALMLDQAGVDGILVGDSLSMVVQGHENTLPVTLDEMIYHAKMVGRAVQRALVVVDMPFPTYQLGAIRAIENAARILKETHCQAVKLESTADQAEIIEALVGNGIPVMAHVGLRPQTVHVMGGYRVQREEQRLVQDAKAAEQAGAFAVVLECIPSSVAARLTEELSIPTIGIGAGPGCDGQVLVSHDMLGLTPQPRPRHVRAYAELGETIARAAGQFCEDVRSGQFPGEKESFA